MTSLFGNINNVILGMAVARDRPRREQLLAGLTAGQMPANSPLGVLFVKQFVDTVEAAEGAQQGAEATSSALRLPIEIELPVATTSATLRVPGVTGVTFSRVSGSDGTTVDAATGVVTLPQATAPGEVTVAIAQDGVVRNLVLLRGPRVQTSTGAGQPATTAQLAALVQALIAALRAQLESPAGNPTPSTPSTPTGGTPTGGGVPAGPGAPGVANRAQELAAAQAAGGSPKGSAQKRGDG